MGIIPGTTPRLTVQLDEEIPECDAAELFIRCGDITILKTLEELDVSEDGTAFSTELAQSETLQFPDNKTALVQLRVAIGDAIFATDVMQLAIGELLHRKEMAYR